MKKESKKIFAISIIIIFVISIIATGLVSMGTSNGKIEYKYLDEGIIMTNNGSMLQHISEDEFLTLGTRIYVQPIITNIDANTFELDELYVDLNNQILSPFIDINGTPYYFNDYDNNKIIFEDMIIPANTEIYYAIDFIGNGTISPVLYNDLKIKYNYTQI